MEKTKKVNEVKKKRMKVESDSDHSSSSSSSSGHEKAIKKKVVQFYKSLIK